ncbi:MAG: hypothetical protein JEY94_09885 [Melioribacteraceae bacterium]|nr:hypothetical protein [Melioribacteraceae bacterium]
MLYEKFIRLVEDHAEKLTKLWVEEVQNNPSTRGYRKINDALLEKRVYDVYKRLGRWLLNEDITFKETAEHYMKLGSERAHEGIQLSEVIYAIVISRLVLWNYVINQGIVNSIFEHHQALEFLQRVTTYFDKAIYFISIGYENSSKADQEKIKKSDFIEKSVNAVTKWIIKDVK